MVRRYQEVVEEIKNKEKHNLFDWTQKVIDALLGLQTTAEKKDVRVVTFEEWRSWTEQLARKMGLDPQTLSAKQLEA